jgi:hypothetical protein
MKQTERRTRTVLGLLVVLHPVHLRRALLDRHGLHDHHELISVNVEADTGSVARGQLQQPAADRRTTNQRHEQQHPESAREPQKETRAREPESQGAKASESQ